MFAWDGFVWVVWFLAVVGWWFVCFLCGLGCVGFTYWLRVAEFLSAWYLGYFDVTVGFIAGAGVSFVDGLFYWYLPVDGLGC